MKINKITLTDDYLEDVLVRLAHHSSAIEGNTISLPDTVSIILHNTIPGKVNIREFYEVENHEQAFEYMIKELSNGTELSINIIKNIHELLTDRLQHDKGEFKQIDNAIKGAEFKTASHQDVPLLMQQWVDNLNYRLSLSKSDEEVINLVGDFHIQFERIHPFSDGNGRIGRMLMNYILLSKGIAPLIIKSDIKNEYINILANQDTDKFLSFSKNIIEEEIERLEKFSNVEQTKIRNPKY